MHPSGIAATASRTLVAALAVFLIAGCGGDADMASPSLPTESAASSPGLQGQLITPPGAKPQFILTDTAGDPFDFAKETTGKLTYLFFGYTHCPDICQIRMSQLAAMQERDNVPPNKVVFVTTDPERDTPAVIRDWLDNFDKSFVGLTGTTQQVAAAQEASNVPIALKKPSQTNPDDYLMSHPSLLQAFAPDGKAYTEYPFGTKIEQYLHDARILDNNR